MLNLAAQENILQQRLQNENLLRRAGQRLAIDDHNLQFPRLPLDYIVSKCFGTYQVKLAPGYIQDKYVRGNGGFEVHLIEPNLIRIRIFSRHVQAQHNTSLILFRAEMNEQNRDPILCTYCTCKVGARTLGVCAHIASILWYLGFARHEEDVHYPPVQLLTTILDAARRNVNNIDEA